jgi:hypothetical protein
LLIVPPLNVKGEVEQILADVAGTAQRLLHTIRGLPGEALQQLDEIQAEIQSVHADTNLAFNTARDIIRSLPAWPGPATPGDLAKASAALRDLQSNAAGFLQRSSLDQMIADAIRPWSGELCDQARVLIDSARSDMGTTLVSLINSLINLPVNSTQAGVIDFLTTATDTAFDTLQSLSETIDEDWRPIFEGISASAQRVWPIEEAIKGWEQEIESIIDNLPDTNIWGALQDQLNSQMPAVYSNLDATLDTLFNRTMEVANHAENIVEGIAEDICHGLIAQLEDLKKWITHVFRDDVLDDLRGLAGQPVKLLSEVDACLSRMLDSLGSLVRHVHVTVPEIAILEKSRNAGENLLRLFRSFGRVPDLPNLEFRMPHIGYYFFDLSKGSLPSLLPEINLSPVAAYANRLLSGLNGINITLPAIKLRDRLIPPSLDSFDLSKILPDIGGLKLNGLFQNLKLPSLANDGVKVTHGVNEATRSAWLQADIDVGYSQTITAFNLAGIQLSVAKARFTATVHVEATLGQPPRERKYGAISGDWMISAGGMPVVTFTDTELRYDEASKIHFDINPARVNLQAPLNFLSNLLASYSSGNSGFHLAITPQGVQTTLILPVPNIQGGTFGIANLTFGLLFGLDWYPAFRIRAALSLGTEEKPFTLTAFILGGAGFLRFGVTYVPGSGSDIATNLTIAIYASASLAISLGPVSGGVYAYLGVQVNYAASTASGSNLLVTLRIMFVGEVCLLGFISVGMSLGLEASYGSGNTLIGSGWISYDIKIGWFIDISIRASITYQFGGAVSTTSSTSVQTAADDYVDMF